MNSGFRKEKKKKMQPHSRPHKHLVTLHPADFFLQTVDAMSDLTYEGFTLCITV